MVGDCGSIAIQSQQVCFLCRPRERLFRVDHVAPSALLADIPRSLLTLLDALAILARGQCDFMNFHLTGCFPYYEIWTQVVADGRNAPDVTWRWFAFEGHDSSLSTF